MFRSGVESPARALLEASQSSSRAATKTTVTTATSSSIQAPVVGAKNGSEVADQTFRAQNLALLKSAIDAIERRRGALDTFDMRSEAAAAQ
jgi:hypothetical protein